MAGQELLDLFYLGKEMEWRYKLDQYEAAAIKELIRVYENAKIDIRRQIQVAPDYVRQEAMMQHLEEMLTGLRSASGMAISEMATLAATQALFEYQNLLSVEGRVSSFNFVSLTKEQIGAWVDEPVGGRLLEEWLQDSFDTRILDNIKSEIGTGLAKGSGFKDIFWRLMDNGINMSRDDAITVARTYVQSVNSKAQQAVYEANDDIVKRVRWCATFENSKKSKGLGTCLSCAALDGQEWETKDKNRPPMPLHPRCRCTMLPVTATYRELGLDIDELEDAARPYTIREPKAIDEGGKRAILEVGQHQGDWGTWLKTRSDKFQRDALGPGRYDLWKSGKVKLEDMVDGKTGRLLRLDELQQLDITKFVPLKTLREASMWASKNYPHIKWDFKGAHIDTINPTLQQFDILAKKYPEVAKKLEYIGTYQNKTKAASVNQQYFKWGYEQSHATKDGRAIGLNPKWYGSPKELIKELQSNQMMVYGDFAVSFSPIGCDTIESLFTHEFGHQVYNYLSAQYPAAFVKYVDTNGFGSVVDTLNTFIHKTKVLNDLYEVSDYATTNSFEAWADGFSLLNHNPDRAKTVTYTIYQKKLLDAFGKFENFLQKVEGDISKQEWEFLIDSPYDEIATKRKQLTKKYSSLIEFLYGKE